MIVTETPEAYRFVTQEAHAALAGQFADRWGGAVERPEPAVPALIAAHEHDAGWHDYDRRPHCHDGPDRDGPVDFREMDAEVWIDLYDAGIDLVADIDPYAGLLVSMHGAGLRNRRYGLAPNWPLADAFADFLDRQHRLQRRLLDDLREDGAYDVSAAEADLLESLHAERAVPAGYDGRLWPNYKLLQAWDTLSLAFCTTADPPAYERIGPVPAGGADATLALERAGEGTVRIEPYPFEEEPLRASVPVRTVDREAAAEEDRLVRAYYRAGREELTVTLRS